MPRRNLNTTYSRRNLYRLFNIFPKFPKEYIRDIYGTSPNILSAIDVFLNRQHDQLIPVIIHEDNQSTANSNNFVGETNENYFNAHNTENFQENNYYPTAYFDQEVQHQSSKSNIFKVGYSLYKKRLT